MNLGKLLAKAQKKQQKEYIKQTEKQLDKAREDPVAMLRGQKSSEYLFKQPSVDGNTVSTGTSESKPELPSRNQITNQSLEDVDFRNSSTKVFEDGTLIDPNPQSWENVKTRPHRNGFPENSTYVDMIIYDPNTQTTEASTKRGTETYEDSDGGEFKELENAGSKGRYVRGLGTLIGQ